MPLSEKIRKEVLKYTRAEAASIEKYWDRFAFVNEQLRETLAQEMCAAIHINKLMEALHVEGLELHAHLKYQIVAYVGVFEALIGCLLWDMFDAHEAMVNITSKIELREVPALAESTQVFHNNEPVVMAKRSRATLQEQLIRFDDKIDAAVEIGFITRNQGDVICSLYKLRNGIHLRNASKRNIAFDLEQSKQAFLLIKQVCHTMRDFLQQKGLFRPQAVVSYHVWKASVGASGV